MKKLALISILFFLVVSVVFSQNWFVGASADFRFSKDSDFSVIGDNIVERETERRTISISPEIGYRINKYDFGIYPIFQYNYMDTEQGSNSSNQNAFGYGMGLFSRYNFITFFDRLSILGRVDLNYLFSIQENISTQNDNTTQNKNLTHSIDLSISPVLEFRLSDRISLYSSIIGNIASIGYGYISREIKNGIEHSGYGHNFTFFLPSVYNFSLTNISLGFYVNF